MRYRRLLRVLFVPALVALQTSVGGPDGFFGVRPDFFLLFVILAGMQRGEIAGAAWGVILGFLQDTFSLGLPGLNLLTKGLLGFVAGTLRDQLDCENPNTQSLVAVVATLAEGSTHLALTRIFPAQREVLPPFLGTVLPAAAAHGVILPCIPALRRWLVRRRRREYPVAESG